MAAICAVRGRVLPVLIGALVRAWIGALALMLVPRARTVMRALVRERALVWAPASRALIDAMARVQML